MVRRLGFWLDWYGRGRDFEDVVRWILPGFPSIMIGLLAWISHGLLALGLGLAGGYAVAWLIERAFWPKLDIAITVNEGSQRGGRAGVMGHLLNGRVEGFIAGLQLELRNVGSQDRTVSDVYLELFDSGTAGFPKRITLRKLRPIAVDSTAPRVTPITKFDWLVPSSGQPVSHGLVFNQNFDNTDELPRAPDGAVIYPVLTIEFGSPKLAKHWRFGPVRLMPR